MYRPCLVALAFGVALVLAADRWTGREVLSVAPREEACVLCQNTTPIAGVRSRFIPRTNDSAWSFPCLSRPANASGPSCWGGWTPEHSQLHANFSLACPLPSFLSGIGSKYYPSHSDREWQLFCSQHPRGYMSASCAWTRWTSPSEDFSFDLLDYEPCVVQGMESRYVVERNHRQWRFLICHVSLGGESHSNTTGSHTHSNVTTEALCDPGYYQNGTVVNGNGTWTWLPMCAECTPIPYCAQTVCTGPLSSRCVRCQAALPSGLPLVLSRSGRRCRAAPVISPGPLGVGFMTGSNVLLNCSAKGRPTPRISWLRVLPSGDRVPVLNHTHHQNGSLTITNATDTDSGLYMCVAWSVAGSAVVYIDVSNTKPPEAAPPSIFHWHPLNIISSRDSTHLHCHTGGFPPPHVTWSYLNTSVQPPSFHTIPSSRVFQYQNGTLQFHLVWYEDTAVYRCEAENLFGLVAMETLVYMETGLDEAGHPLSIPDWTASYSASEGEHVEMTCNTSSLPPHSSVLWMKKGGRAAPGGTGIWQNGNGTLVMEHVSQEEEGPYWCVVWNEDYVAMETTNLVINGTSPTPPPFLSTSNRLCHCPSLVLATLFIWHTL